MNTRGWMIGFAALVLLGFGASRTLAEDDPLAEALRRVIAGHLAAYDREDVAATMSFVDSKSPDYESTKAALAGQFEQLDVSNELVDFALIGHDDEFAVARARIKSVGKPGGGFTDNTVDTILIFRQENAAWKLWDESILGVEIH
jgi:ketosteroid isomerase-like protein